MKYFFLLVILILFGSCANSVKETEEVVEQNIPSEGIEILSGSYQLISLNGEDVSSEDIYMKIDKKGESLVINTGCNVLMVDFIQQEEKIKFQQPVSTEMYCEGKMENEEYLKKILPEISEIENAAGDLLYLKNEKDVLLTIQKNRE